MLRFFLLLCFLVVALIADGSEKDGLAPIPQAVWSKEGTQPVPERMGRHSEGITSVVIHHTQSPNEIAAFQRARLVNVQRYHIVEREWGDVAYHYLIGSDGRIFEGRDAEFQGDSGTSYDLDGRLLICVLGDFTKELPSEEALNSLIEWTARSLKKNGLTGKDLVTHRMVAATDCPGDRLQEWFEGDGKALIEARLSELSETP
ncbi:MAG: peptidoglycan recognition family protein [Verrucomicrobiales bacterium]|nr:peptidoglycan recognition family protein [Verrucomicrobiales bacterium]